MYFIMQNSRSLKEAFDSLREVKFCIGQRKNKQKFTTQGRSDQASEFALAHFTPISHSAK